MSQKVYATERLSLTRPLEIFNKIQRRFVRSNDICKLFAASFFLPFLLFLGKALQKPVRDTYDLNFIIIDLTFCSESVIKTGLPT